MRIESPNGNRFCGKFYATTDGHGRSKMLAGVLTEIEKQAKNKKESHFLIDGGDIIGDLIPLNVSIDLFKKFHQRNPHVKMLFNMGNFEIWNLVNQKAGEFFEVLKDLTQSGFKILSLTSLQALKSQNKSSDLILPYTIVEDTLPNGKTERILISGLSEFYVVGRDKTLKAKGDVEEMKLALKNDLLPAYQKEKPDKIILLMHCMPEKTNAVLDYAKEIGIENLDLVFGGHPHSIDDYIHNESRILYPPAQWKGAFVVNNTEKGFLFDKVETIEHNKYIYEPIEGNKSVISNINIQKPLKADEEYLKILENPICENFNRKVATASVSLKFRNEYNSKLSEPTELGTFIANAYRDFTNADIGLMLSMDLREKVPQAGSEVSYYNICDAMNVDKGLCKYKEISANELKNMLEISLKGQNEGIKNPDFIEYSDNLKIVRFANPKDDNNKIAQIYFKENGEFIPLLNDSQQELSDRKFSVTTCEFVAKGPSRESLKYFSQFPSEKIEGLSTRKIFAEQYKNFEEKNITSFSAAEIETV